MKKFLRPCQKCGETVSRNVSRMDATCFKCKVKRRQKANRKYQKKLRESRKDAINALLKAERLKVASKPRIGTF